MIVLKKIGHFLRKHRFPKHGVGIIDFITQWCSFAVWTLHAWVMLKLQGCPIGSGFRADGRLFIRVEKWGAIRIGNNFRINSRFGSNYAGPTNPAMFTCEGQGRIEIGNNSGVSAAVISSRGNIFIGNRVTMGANVRIFDHDFHSLTASHRTLAASDRLHCKVDPVHIADDVLIGANVFILKGVSLGPRTIVGAGSVVTLRDVPADCIVAGNPARIIRGPSAS